MPLKYLLNSVVVSLISPFSCCSVLQNFCKKGSYSRENSLFKKIPTAKKPQPFFFFFLIYWQIQLYLEPKTKMQWEPKGRLSLTPSKEGQNSFSSAFSVQTNILPSFTIKSSSYNILYREIAVSSSILLS